MRPRTQQRLRQYHLYLGVLFAPLLLLFSVSGVVQTFRLPDQPGAATWMKWIAAVHKDQGPPRERAPRPRKAEPMADHDHDHEDAKPAAASSRRPDPLPLKVFVTLMSLGLIVSIVLGLAIALSSRATRRISTLLLVAGTVLPCVLLYL